MSYTEETALFACAGEVLVGILAKPEIPAEIGVVVIVGGPQYRAGSHRQFVLLSRALAQASFAVLRFDYRGMGDSEGQQRDFLAVSEDVGMAIGALQDHIPSVKKIALWGLCDGASAALIYCQEIRDPRVVGLCLLNPWVRSDASLALTQVKHYYTQRLREKEFWAKLLSGKVASSAVSGLVKSVRTALTPQNHSKKATENLSFQQKMASAWKRLDGKILLLLSGKDYTAKEFLEHATTSPQWSAQLTQHNLSRYDMPSADHTFSDLLSRELVEKLTITWLAGIHGNDEVQTMGTLLN